jgi:hypothetical protein
MHTHTLKESAGSLDSKSSIPHESREAKLDVVKEFDASKAIEQMTELLKPSGYHERIVVNFSDVSGIKPGELFRLFAELSQCPQFNYIEIRIEGLQFGYDFGETKLVEEQN